MVDDDELERHISRIENDFTRGGNAGTGTAGDVEHRVSELETTVMRIGEELVHRLDELDRGMPESRTQANMEERLATVEECLTAIEERLD